MGGTAFGEPCRRLRATEHREMAEEATRVLTEMGLFPRIIPSHRSKIDHGDIDILCLRGGGSTSEISLAFGATRERVNGDCLSLLWKGAQLDIIFADEEAVDSTYCYLAWPDLGNFIGRIARAYGFRYGHLGLGRRVECPAGQNIQVIPLSMQPSDIMRFFDFDYSRWLQGFDGVTDIYSFLASSAFFDESIFHTHNLDHRARVRNRKRPVYAGLLEWCKKNRALQGLENQKCSKWWDDRCDLHFGRGWRSLKSEWEAGNKRRQDIKDKFNGRWAQNLSGLSGTVLGEAMREFRAVRGEGFEDWILTIPQDTIADEFSRYLANRRAKVESGGC